MTIYLGGSSKDKDTCRTLGYALAVEGFNVLAPWLSWTPETHPNEQKNWLALLDCIQRASAMVYVGPPTGIFSAGATFEAGYALGLHRPVYLYSPRDRSISDPVYHWSYAANVYRIEDWEFLLESLSWTKGALTR